MKIFTKTNNRLLDRGILLLSAIVVGLVSCQRNVEPPQEGDPNELTLTATHPVPIEKLSSVQSRSTLDEFTADSRIGLYVQLKSESEQGSEVVMKSNSLYRYDQPVWQPNSKEEKLQYHETDPVYIFGYYPHPSMPGSSTNVAEGSSVVDFTLIKDQSVAQDVKMSDLLWVGAKNEGVGYQRQRVPVNLLFYHKLCKVSFYVKVIDSKPETGTSGKVFLRSLSAAGAQITNKANLKVLNGVVEPVYQPNHLDSVRWESSNADGVELTVGQDAVYIADLLLVPFVALPSENWFRYVIYYPQSGMAQNFSAAIPKYDPAAEGASAAKLNFVSNQHNKVTVTIDISSVYTSISAEIAPWATGPVTELPTEPA